MPGVMHIGDIQEMKIFFSWSGELSQKVANIFYEYLPLMLNEVDIFMSEHDIESGTSWSIRLSEELNETNYCIVFLTPDNLIKPWILFEAGAISKQLGSRVCSLLIKDLRPQDLNSPLSLFQNRIFNKKDIYKLLNDINSKLKKPLTEKQLESVFKKWWPDIESEYNKSLFSRPDNTRVKLSERELLEELVLRVRSLEKKYAFVDPVYERSSTDLLSRPLNFDSLSWYSIWKYPGKKISEYWQSRLLSDINPEKYPRISNIDDAIMKAKKAVDEYSRINPEYFRYSTDFITKSLGFVDLDFRKNHSWSKDTLNAFEKYSKLIQDK